MANGKRRTKIELAEFEAKVVQLRRNGVPLERIAQSTGDNVSTVWRAFQRALGRIRAAEVKELRDLQSARLEEVFRLSMALGQRGSVSALGHALKALKQQAKLFGLNAPVITKMVLVGEDGEPIKTNLGLTAQDLDEMTVAERDTIRRIAERQAKRSATLH